jgi:hypothetical protein
MALIVLPSKEFLTFRAFVDNASFTNARQATSPMHWKTLVLKRSLMSFLLRTIVSEGPEHQLIPRKTFF